MDPGTERRQERNYVYGKGPRSGRRQERNAVCRKGPRNGKEAGKE
jgi:hypothetical protein